MIAVEGEAQILVHHRLGGVAIIGSEGGQQMQRLGAKAFLGGLAGFPVTASIGDFLQPMANLPVHIRQVGKAAQGPEVLAQIAYGSLDLAFLPGGPHVTSSRQEAVLPGEGQESGDGNVPGCHRVRRPQ